jgi:hypothetical protein
MALQRGSVLFTTPAAARRSDARRADVLGLLTRFAGRAHGVIAQGVALRQALVAAHNHGPGRARHALSALAHVKNAAADGAAVRVRAARDGAAGEAEAGRSAGRVSLALCTCGAAARAVGQARRSVRGALAGVAVAAAGAAVRTRTAAATRTRAARTFGAAAGSGAGEAAAGRRRHADVRRVARVVRRAVVARIAAARPVHAGVAVGVVGAVRARAAAAATGRR